MELWIRSQDKKQLSLIYGIIVAETQLRGFTSYHQNYFELGTYKSRKRALEVLDEIQDLMRSLTDSDLKIIQYEMPEK